MIGAVVGGSAALVLAGLTCERGVAWPIVEAATAMISGLVPVPAIADALLMRPLRPEADRAAAVREDLRLG